MCKLCINQTYCISCNNYYYVLKTEIIKNSNYFHCYNKKDFRHYFIDKIDNTLIEYSNNCTNCVNSSDHCVNCEEEAYKIEGENSGHAILKK